MITHPTNHPAMDQIAVYLIFSDFLLFPLIYWFLFMYSWLYVFVTSLNRSEASSDLIPDHISREALAWTHTCLPISELHAPAQAPDSSHISMMQNHEPTTSCFVSRTLHVSVDSSFRLLIQWLVIVFT